MGIHKWEYLGQSEKGTPLACGVMEGETELTAVVLKSPAANWSCEKCGFNISIINGDSKTKPKLYFGCKKERI